MTQCFPEIGPLYDHCIPILNGAHTFGMQATGVHGTGEHATGVHGTGEHATGVHGTGASVVQISDNETMPLENWVYSIVVSDSTLSLCCTELNCEVKFLTIVFVAILVW